MKKFKKFICIICATLFCLGVSENVLAGSPKIEVRNFTNRVEYGGPLPNNEGVWFDLISPKGARFFNVLCMIDSNVPYDMDKTLLPLCTELLGNCIDGAIHGAVDISIEKYHELTKICQVMLGKGRRKPDTLTKENMFKKLISNIFEIYGVKLKAVI